MSDVAIIQAATFLTVVAGFAFQIYRENRQRKWDIEDRRLLALKVQDSATVVKQSASAQTKQLHEAIRENTDISTKAFHEANTVNQKLEKLGINQMQMHEEQE